MSGICDINCKSIIEPRRQSICRTLRPGESMYKRKLFVGGLTRYDRRHQAFVGIPEQHRRKCNILFMVDFGVLSFSSGLEDGSG